MADQIVEFVRKKDLHFVQELGQGACGKTVILYDDIIDECFVCKKYSPIIEELKTTLFKNFIHEIKILHTLNHTNIVRVFNYYLYPDQLTGYILMELIKGRDIEEYISTNPEYITTIFEQVISGFQHLERNNVLHRDIRPQNILVSDEGVAKIIDFGFGKQVITPEDFDKSISLNWWCEVPADFQQHKYNFTTEVYFVGKLFKKIIEDGGIEEFSYKDILRRMCAHSSKDRIQSFISIRQEMLSGQFSDIEFNNHELQAYRAFADELDATIVRIEESAKYVNDPDDIIRKLENCYRRVMLEIQVPRNNIVIQCLLSGAFYFSSRHMIKVSAIKGFLDLMRGCSKEKKSIIINNLFTRLDARPRYDESADIDDEIPF